MQTDTVYACFVEIGDYLEINEVAHEVTDVTDTSDFIVLKLRDFDGEAGSTTLAPFDHVSVVTSFEDSFEFEDVDIDA